MPSSIGTLATLRPDLADSLEEYNLQASREGFIGHQVFPIVDTAQAAGTFGIIPIEQLLQSRITRRAAGTGYARGTWKFKPGSYACEEHGAEEPIDDRESKIYKNYFDAELIATDKAYDAVLRNAEIRIADKVFDASAFSAQKNTIVNEWDDYVNAVPVTDVETAVRAAHARSGIWPNALIVNELVFRNIKLCESVKEEIIANGAGSPATARDINIEMLKSVFNLDYILVGSGDKNTADEGQPSVITPIWSNEYAMVCRVSQSANFKDPCIGRTFHFTGDGSEPYGRVEMYREEQIRGNVVRVRNDVDEKMLYPSCAQLLDNVTT